LLSYSFNYLRHLEKLGVTLGSLFDSLKEKGYEIQLVEGKAKAISAGELIKLCKQGRRNKFGTLINQAVFCA